MIGVRPEGGMCEACSEYHQIGGICEVSSDIPKLAEMLLGGNIYGRI